MDQLGKTLRQYRKTRRMTQTELATAVGVAPAYVSQIESSLRVPSLRVARRIAEVLHVELPALLGGTTADPIAEERLSDVEKLQLLRTLTRGVEQDLETRPVREDVETYPGSVAARLASRAGVVVRSYAFGEPIPRTVLHRHHGFETVFCACGEAVVRFGSEERTLEPGDLVRFDASQPHTITGRLGTVVISTAEPPPTAETLERDSEVPPPA